MRKDKGITLIALVITIIVLLILAAVSITALTDEDKGVVTKAKQAASKTEDAADEEDADIQEIMDYADSEDWGDSSNSGNTGDTGSSSTVITDIYQKVYLYRPGAASSGSSSGLGLTSIQVLGEPDNELVKIYLSDEILTASDVSTIKANGSGFTYTNVTTPVKYLPNSNTYIYLFVEYEDGTTTNVLRFNISEVKASSSHESYGVIVG